MTTTPAQLKRMDDDAKRLILETALREIVRLNAAYAADRYGDSKRAGSMGCVQTAQQALLECGLNPEPLVAPNPLLARSRLNTEPFNDGGRNSD